MIYFLNSFIFEAKNDQIKLKLSFFDFLKFNEIKKL